MTFVRNLDRARVRSGPQKLLPSPFIPDIKKAKYLIIKVFEKVKNIVTCDFFVSNRNKFRIRINSAILGFCKNEFG